MNMKTLSPFELHDAALDWAVAQCLGRPVTIGTYYEDKVIYVAPFDGREFAPSRTWGTGGPILQDAARHDPVFWENWKSRFPHSSPDILETALQCLVASLFKEGINVPVELL